MATDTPETRRAALPKADGRTPDDQRFIFTGSHLIPEAHQEPHPYNHSRFFAVVELEIIGVGHKDTAHKVPRLARIETSGVKRFAFVPDDIARQLIVEHGYDDQSTLFDEDGNEHESEDES